MNDFDNFISDLRQCEVCFDTEEMVFATGSYYCSCYDFQVIFNFQVYKGCIHETVVELIDYDATKGLIYQPKKQKRGRRAVNPLALERDRPPAKRYRQEYF